MARLFKCVSSVDKLVCLVEASDAEVVRRALNKTHPNKTFMIMPLKFSAQSNLHKNSGEIIKASAIV